MKRQDIYNKLSVGLLLLLLLSSSSSSILVYTFDSFNLRTIAREHTHDLHPEIYLSMCYLYSTFASALPKFQATCKKCMGISIRM